MRRDFFLAMIVARISDGLGNQLFQYAAGRALAVRLGTALGFDPSLLRRDPSRRYELHRFNVRGGVISSAHKTLIRLSTSPRLRAVRPALRAILPGVAYTHFQDRNAGYDPTFASLSGNVYLDGYWQSEKYFAGIADDIRKELTLRTAADEQNQRAWRRIAATPQSVCVHVRRGDYLSNPAYRVKYPICDLDYYERALRTVREELEDPSFFVFSDDPDWAQSSLQFDGPAEFLDFNVGKQDYADLYLMSACRHFIIANSTFSWWGAWLAEGLDKLVIAPRQWFASGAGHSDNLIPASWKRL